MVMRLSDPLVQGLACAAIEPGLRGILLVDGTPALVRWCGAVLAQMVAVVASAPPSQVILGAGENEDTLWGLPGLPDGRGQSRTLWPGRITGGRRGQPPQVVMLPTLERLSLAAERAAVMAMDAAVIHLERHGEQVEWQPAIWWVAGCAQNDLGKVSPHLLDRFLLRLTVDAPPEESEALRAGRLEARLKEAAGDDEAPTLSAEVIAALQQASGCAPGCGTDVLADVVQRVAMTEHYSPRRDLALARLAVAQARLMDRAQVSVEDVAVAAALMGLAGGRRAEVQPERVLPESAPMCSEEREATEPVARPAAEPLLLDERAAEVAAPTPVPVYAGDTRSESPVTQLRADTETPWREDGVAPEREVAALQLPWQVGRRGRAGRGPVVGVEASHGLEDLAVVQTLFTALKAQGVRRRQRPGAGAGLVVRASDLRRYRRLPLPESLLVLVLDYTALRQCAWEEALWPHLEWAYTTRAGIALIQVGARGATHELRAERLLGRSLLDPRIGAGLVAEAGRATPLAHGLALAGQTVRHALQHGRSVALAARVVVVSDGRGNVPLAASYAGQVTLPVNREGITDALLMAAELRQLERTTVVLLDPQPAHYADLPQALAESLGVQAQPIARREDEEGGEVAR